MTLYRSNENYPNAWKRDGMIQMLIDQGVLIEVAIDPVEMGRYVVATGAYIAGLTNGDLQEAVKAATKDVEP